MQNVQEVARVVKQWLTLESEMAADAEADTKTYVELDSDIAAAKQGLDSDTEPVRRQFANLLFSGDMAWLRADSNALEGELPEWFVAGSNDEYYLEQYATDSRTDIKPVLNFLSARLEIWARGESRPQQNPDFEEATWPAGTQWYKYENGQWLYGPTRDGNDWQTMDKRAPAAGEPAAADEPVGDAPIVDVSTAELAQQASVAVAAAVQDLLAEVLRVAPEQAAEIGEEQLKQWALAAIIAAAQE